MHHFELYAWDRHRFKLKFFLQQLQCNYDVAEICDLIGSLKFNRERLPD